MHNIRIGNAARRRASMMTMPVRSCPPRNAQARAWLHPPAQKSTQPLLMVAEVPGDKLFPDRAARCFSSRAPLGCGGRPPGFCPCGWPGRARIALASPRCWCGCQSPRAHPYLQGRVRRPRGSGVDAVAAHQRERAYALTIFCAQAAQIAGVE